MAENSPKAHPSLTEANRQTCALILTFGTPDATLFDAAHKVRRAVAKISPFRRPHG